MSTLQQLSAKTLRERLVYEPGTGVFRRMLDEGGCKAGAEAGHRHKNGRVNIFVLGKLYRAHRLAWLYVTGVWPIGDIDHINGDPGDNRFANLRDVTKSVNQQNRRASNRDAASGLLGVSWHSIGKKWRATIRVDGKSKYLGLFDDEYAAHEAYLKAKRELHAGCTL